ncbi:uncharacterized protein BROUX77_005038 [Berkeleyomyces rouxiae]|uniref:uncharacterized protein n=1 Tax=Berkeleyomyces rouxiae TaxID=2035830 RepID=UPI003B7D21DF
MTQIFFLAKLRWAVSYTKTNDGYINPIPASSRPHLQGDKKAAAAAHLALVRSSSPSDLWIYTDGSKLGEGRVGAGWAIIRDGTVLDTGNCPIPFHAEVHDAEVMAIARALEKVDSWVKPQRRKVWVCSDNLAAVYRLTTWGAKPGTSEELLRRAQTICADWIGQSPDHPGPRPWPDGAPAVEVIWVPGHSDVWGNELADRQAKMGAERAYTPVGMSLSWARSHFRARITTEFRTWWSNEGCANRPHLSRPLQAPKKAWKNLLDDTERKLARAVLTALSGHGDYADYHRRFNHLNAVLTCPLCDAETTPEHIWTCPRNPQRMAKGFFQKLMATKSGAIWLASKAAKSPPVLLAHRRAVTGTDPQEGDSPVRPPPDPPPPCPTLHHLVRPCPGRFSLWSPTFLRHRAAKPLARTRRQLPFLILHKIFYHYIDGEARTLGFVWCHADEGQPLRWAGGRPPVIILWIVGFLYAWF